MFCKSKIATVAAVFLAILVASMSCAGSQGSAGVGINKIVNNGDGTFTLCLTDGSNYTTDNLTGPQGPSGLGYNPMQIALLRWYQVNQASISFYVGSSPIGVCFDGASIYVVCGVEVRKLKASDGSVLGANVVGSGPRAICFDGANIWVANLGTNSISKL